MEDICEALQNIVIEHYKIGKNYKVHVTFINNPHSFYIQPIKCTYLKLLEKPGKPVQASNLFPGSTIVYKSQISNHFVRGHVIGENKPDCFTFSIFAIDYGYMEKSVSIQQIFQPENLVDVPPLARHCRLGNCEPFDAAFTYDVTEAMQHYIGNECCVMLVKAFQSDQMIVQLNNSCPNDIATMLALTQFTHFGCVNNTSVSRMKSIKPVIPSFHQKSLEVNELFNVHILRAVPLLPRTYYVATVSDFTKYINECVSFTSYCRGQRRLSKEYLEIGVPVAYRGSCDRFYERAVIKSILESNSKAVIYLIDKGETKEAFICQMREVTSLHYIENPGIAFQCTFEDSAEVAQKLHDTVTAGDKAWIKIKKIGDPNIVEIIAKPD